MTDSYELVFNIKEYVRGRANEISHRIPKADADSIHDLLAQLDTLEDDLRNFDEIIDEAWNEKEVF